MADPSHQHDPPNVADPPNEDASHNLADTQNDLPANSGGDPNPPDDSDIYINIKVHIIFELEEHPTHLLTSLKILKDVSNIPISGKPII